MAFYEIMYLESVYSKLCIFLYPDYGVFFFSLQALADPYFHGLANLNEEPSTQPISKLDFEFERRKLTNDDVRGIIYREQTDFRVSSRHAEGVPSRHRPYQLHVSKTVITCGHGFDLIFQHVIDIKVENLSTIQIAYVYVDVNSGIDQFKQQFARLEEQYGKRERVCPLRRKYTSLPRERINGSDSEDEAIDKIDLAKKRTSTPVVRATLLSPPSLQGFGESKSAHRNASGMQNGSTNGKCRALLRSDSISASKCVGVIGKH
ncbi:hypothetical protein EZV62_018524 [Acer yangbiense]|uniref:Uncharacterized protein n=1 Tax=Acer yangbiense TaxID=1000413 RepID=A0A5C7HJM2_9ROSI|nr:hypothetical protein EZV62_018524 [Acer yangbiense]